jgi:hypothetical protein
MVHSVQVRSPVVKDLHFPFPLSDYYQAWSYCVVEDQNYHLRNLDHILDLHTHFALVRLRILDQEGVLSSDRNLAWEALVVVLWAVLFVDPEDPGVVLEAGIL